MHPFWEPVIAPILDAMGARTVVEVGALRGDNTRQMLNCLGPESVLHVIDPVPDFDPTELEREAPGRYEFHQAPSLDVLGELSGVDAALIDGDHNWYTVVNELRLLRDRARADGGLLPVLFLHDVGWPYGRRDLYYEPDRIPGEYRNPYRRAGMRPGRTTLVPDGGMSSGLCNAESEGGPRNGVLTAVDDFVSEHDEPLRVIVLPVYFGLAIVIEERRLQLEPAVAETLRRVESAEGLRTLLELGEQIRVRSMTHHHNVVRRAAERTGRLATRYLETLTRTLSIDHGTGSGELRALLDALDAARESGVAGDHLVIARDPAPALLCSEHGEAYGHEAATHVDVESATDGRVAVAFIAANGVDDLDTLLERLHRQLAVGAAVVVSGLPPEGSSTIEAHHRRYGIEASVHGGVARWRSAGEASGPERRAPG